MTAHCSAPVTASAQRRCARACASLAGAGGTARSWRARSIAPATARASTERANVTSATRALIVRSARARTAARITARASTTRASARPDGTVTIAALEAARATATARVTVTMVHAIVYLASGERRVTSGTARWIAPDGGIASMASASARSLLPPDCATAACHNGCSRNGYCLNGTCFCRPGFEGSDCSRSGCPVMQWSWPRVGRVLLRPSGVGGCARSRAARMAAPAMARALPGSAAPLWIRGPDCSVNINRGICRMAAQRVVSVQTACARAMSATGKSSRASSITHITSLPSHPLPPLHFLRTGASIARPLPASA